MREGQGLETAQVGGCEGIPAAASVGGRELLYLLGVWFPHSKSCSGFGILSLSLAPLLRVPPLLLETLAVVGLQGQRLCPGLLGAHSGVSGCWR